MNDPKNGVPIAEGNHLALRDKASSSRMETDDQRVRIGATMTRRNRWGYGVTGVDFRSAEGEVNT